MTNIKHFARSQTKVFPTDFYLNLLNEDDMELLRSSVCIMYALLMSKDVKNASKFFSPVTLGCLDEMH